MTRGRSSPGGRKPAHDDVDRSEAKGRGAPTRGATPERRMLPLDRLDLTNLEIIQAARSHLSRVISLLK